MRKLVEALKLDVALVPASIAAATTGAFHAMKKFGRGLFVWETAAMAVGVTSIAQIVQATDAAGTNVKDIVGATATITANTNVTEATLVADLDVTGSSVTINGITFTGAAATNAALRQYKQTVALDTANGLATCINDPTYGVPGVKATSNGVDTVTLTVSEPGDTTITVAVANGAGLVAATTKALGYVEIDASDLDLVGGFTHVALKVTPSAATVTGATLLRGEGRFTPTQAVAS